MEFWGAEVKPGKPLKVAPEKDDLIRISQATLDCKGKMTDSVLLTVTVDGQKLVIGTLSQEKFPQISFDLVFEKVFELSHNCTKGSVHFIGYRSPNIQDDYSGSEEEEEEEVVVPAPVAANGTGVAATNVVKAETKPKAKPEEAKPEEVKPEEDESDESSDEEDDSDDDDSEKGMDIDAEDSDDSEEESEEEEETPQKPEPSNKKRAAESTSKTPISAKKAKPAAAPASTPQKISKEKKKGGGHTATPHPAKKSGKTPVNANQSPKSGGNKKPFNSGKQGGGSNSKGKGKGRA